MKEKFRELSIPAFTRQGQIASFDAEARTAEMVFSTGARVHRFDFFFGEFFEEVSMKEEASDLSRVGEGAVPFLRDHGSNIFRGPVIADVLGRVIEASVDGERGVAKVLFSRRPDALPAIQDIKDGVLRAVSMGYVIRELQKVGEKDGVPVLQAIDWQLYEISSVAMPADPGASFRSIEQLKKLDRAELKKLHLPKLFPCKIRGLSDEEFDAMRKRIDDFSEFAEQASKKFEGLLGDGVKSEKGLKSQNENAAEKGVETSQALPEDQRTGETEMNEAEKKALEEKKAAEAKRLADEAKAQELADAEKRARAEGAKEERERVSGIQKVCRAAKLDESFENKLISEGSSVDKAREAAIEELAKRDEDSKNQTRSVRVEGGGLDADETRKEGMKEAILHRGFAGYPESEKKYVITEKGRRFAGMTLLEMIRENFRLRGVDVSGMSRSQLAARSMHSTSDFPEITADIINKSLRDAFVAAPQTFSPFTRRVQNPDFKQISRVQLGHGAALEKVPQGGEVKSGTVSEAAEKYSIDEYAKMIAITRKLIINDDLDAFTRIPASMGVKARSLESDLVWGVITANALLADGFALFATEHGNLAGSGAAPSVTTLGAARSAMRSQVDLDGEKLNLEMQWIAVPTELETVAEQLVSQIQPQEASNVNPFGPMGRTPLGLIVEPRLSDDSAVKWYTMASLSQVDMVELATLSGTTEPEVISEETFDTLGMKFRVVHSVGAKAIDFRGLYQDPGA